MLRRIIAHVRKELLLLVRDRAGLALLYVMPIVLVSIMAVVQDAPFRDFADKQVKVLFRDLDGGLVGAKVRSGLDISGSFTITDAGALSEEEIKEEVRKGHHQVAVIVPAGASKVLQDRSANAMDGLFGQITGDSVAPVAPDSAFVRMIVDPTVKHAFRELSRGALIRILAGLSSEQLLVDMHARMEAITGDTLEPLRMMAPFIGVEQRLAAGETSGVLIASDSTQHNVPAWTIFAMFFTVVMLAGNMVKERNSGCMARLLTMPGGVAERILGRAVAYLFICITQLGVLLAMGHWVLPVWGLPSLVLGPPKDLALLLLAAVFISGAATSFGVLVGSFARTQQQSAILGSSVVVIMSAIGGIWVPLYIMPQGMQIIGRFSPLNWSMEAFNVILLRQGDLGELVLYLLPLAGFSVLCLAITVVAERIASSN
jgi:ABC-2 type transport system permease protein